jgi:hypothetical protein
LAWRGPAAEHEAAAYSADWVIEGQLAFAAAGFI